MTTLSGSPPSRAPVPGALDDLSRMLIELLAASDPEIAEAMTLEATRQAETLELIASENHVSPAVMHTMGS